MTFDDDKLMQAFRSEFEATRDLRSAVRAVAMAAAVRTMMDEDSHEAAAAVREVRLSARPVQPPIPREQLAEGLQEVDGPEIIRVVCERLNITHEQFHSTCRRRPISEARFVAAWIMRLRRTSYPAIGWALGLDHTSVLHGVRRVEASPLLLRKASDLARALVERTNGAEDVAA